MSVQRSRGTAGAGADGAALRFSFALDGAPERPLAGRKGGRRKGNKPRNALI